MQYNFVVMGPPLCGKGTQSKNIAKRFGNCIVSPGDIFRKEVKKNSELGKKVKNIVHAGKLVPDLIVIEAIKPRLNSSECKNKGFILDGFPRTFEQLKFLENFCLKTDRKITHVILLQIDENEMIERSHGRKRIDDQSIAILKTRNRLYKNETIPIIQYYSNNDMLIEIDGMGSIGEVWIRLYEEIIKKVHMK